MEYTKGKWYTVTHDSGEVTIETREQLIAKVPNHAGTNSGEVEANAHLISAAPDMYGALKQAEVELRFYRERAPKKWITSTGETRYQMIEQALSKAEGK